jgi:HEAT repeats
MALELDLPEMPATDLVTLLADPHRAFRAYTRLLALGSEATEAARGGLGHPDERVRERCCKILDHLMDADSIPPLIGALADPCERVRIAAVHALACDRCKTDACRPTPEAVLPAGVGLLAGDPSALVRAYAAELVGQWAHSRPAARDAITRAAAHDPSPSVRKKASWYAPGGAIYERTAPRPAPRRRRRGP